MNEDTHLVIHAKDSTRGKDNYLPDLKNCRSDYIFKIFSKLKLVLYD